MSSPYTTVGFGVNDDGVSKKRRKRFSFEEGKTVRMSFALWPVIEKDGRLVLDMDFDSPQIESAMTNYIDGVGHVVNKGPEYTKIAGEAPSARLATVLCVWPTDRSGVIDQTAFKRGDVDVVPYVFSGKKFDLFKPLHSECHFGEWDVTVKCEDTKYQKISITPARKNLLREVMTRNPTRFKEILAEIQEVSENLHWFIGMDMSLDRLREKLGIETEGLVDSGPREASLDGDEDFDNLLGDLDETEDE